MQNLARGREQLAQLGDLELPIQRRVRRLRRHLQAPPSGNGNSALGRMVLLGSARLLRALGVRRLCPNVSGAGQLVNEFIMVRIVLAGIIKIVTPGKWYKLEATDVAS